MRGFGDGSARRSRIVRGLVWLGPAVAILFATASGTAYLQQVVELCGVYSMLALSLNLAVGFLGQFSLGHSGLFAVGAYAAVIAVNTWHLSLGVALLVAIAVTTVVGLAIGVVSLRLGGLYFAIVTLAFASVAYVVANRWTAVTGGAAGMVGPIFPNFPSWLAWAGNSLVWCAGLAVLTGMFITANIRRSPFYSVLAATRDAEQTAVAAGIHTARLKIGMFCLSAALAGVAGWLFMFLGFVSPESFQYTLAIQVLVMVLLGGMNTVVGPVLGASLITLFPQYVNISPEWQQWLYGVVLILVVVLAPAGIVGIFRRGAHQLARARLRSFFSGGMLQRALGPEARRRDPTQTVSDGGSVVEQVIAAAALAPQRDDEPARAALSCENVSFRYAAGMKVLDGVSFSVRPGTIHGIIGPNGSGKTTLVNVLSGFARPERGRVLLGGNDVTRLSPASRAGHGLARTFQTARPVAELSCLENCYLGLYRRVPLLALRAPVWMIAPRSARTERELGAQSLAILAWLGLELWADQRAGEVPHAVQRSLQLAVCAAAQPSVIILDEPMAGLTPGEIDLLMKRLAALRSEGTTIVLIEHHIRAVFGISDEITVLSAGEVIAHGSPAEVREDDVVQGAYLGARSTHGRGEPQGSRA
jgi:branched-chain amino acid transport system permease protein